MRFLLVVAALVFLLAGPAGAGQLVGDAAVPFSADRTVTWKGKSYDGKVYAIPGRQRHEQEFGAFKVVAILQADLETVYLVVPDLHLFTRLPFPKAVTEQGEISRLGPPVGRATIAGRPAEEYRVDRVGSDGSAVAGALYLSRDWIVLKLDGDYTAPLRDPQHGTLELSNIVTGPQDPALFELPPGMNELPPQALESMLTLRLPRIKG
jgi:hypothetical protein